MASFTYTAGDTWLTITVRGLSSGQRVRYYIRRDPGTTSIIDKIYISSGSSLTKTFDGLSQNTDYVANAGVVTGNSTAWIGAKYFTTKASSGGGDGPTRPNDWQWWSIIQAGAVIRISANEWNSFCSRINEFRTYKGMSQYWFDTVRSGDPISAYIVNQAISAINNIPGHGSLPHTVSSGDACAAYIFTQLKDALNRIG